MAASKMISKLDQGIAQHVVTYGTSLTSHGAWVQQLRERPCRADMATWRR